MNNEFNRNTMIIITQLMVNNDKDNDNNNGNSKYGKWQSRQLG